MSRAPPIPGGVRVCEITRLPSWSRRRRRISRHSRCLSVNNAGLHRCSTGLSRIQFAFVVSGDPPIKQISSGKPHAFDRRHPCRDADRESREDDAKALPDMRRSLAPMLFDDHDRGGRDAQRTSPVAKAKPAPAAQRNPARKLIDPAEGEPLPVHSSTPCSATSPRSAETLSASAAIVSPYCSLPQLLCSAGPSLRPGPRSRRRQ